MSYILDALRKSEQQRRLGATPTLHGAAAPAESAVVRRRWWPPVVALALAGAAFAAGWLQPWREPPAVSATASPPAPPTPTVAASDAPVKVKEAPVQRVAIAAPPATSAAVQPERERPAPVKAEEKALSSKAREPAPSPRHAQPHTPSAPKSKAETKAQEKILTLAELPAELRAELPAMTITVHSFTPTAAQRLVGVNNRFLHEGEALAPDLVLERITPDGMVFNFRGTRFHRGLR